MGYVATSVVLVWLSEISLVMVSFCILHGSGNKDCKVSLHVTMHPSFITPSHSLFSSVSHPLVIQSV